ncbi:hypothetical protein HNR46_002305 [Haloferula luteola]|uniref:Yip1 domain-containing protein n=1 Tax=Haloferula luteola TaxID=595692 RepID=A0A840V8Z5_9BACT|nr:hypothetical protein [Haloferula luteola]MBB5352064.1 hypothetical protein [Haloferula luteola]
MNFSAEYRIQGILGSLHAPLIVGGCLSTGAILKVRGYPDEFTELPLRLAFVRNWGFLLILIPLGWVVLTIWLERHQAIWFSKRWTVATGIAVGGMMGWYLLGTLVLAGSSIIQKLG